MMMMMMMMMLRQIMVTECADSALNALVAGSTTLLVNGPANICLSSPVVF
jgi:hypothetical protein